jgi:hypothetical protein
LQLGVTSPLIHTKGGGPIKNFVTAADPTPLCPLKVFFVLFKIYYVSLGGIKGGPCKTFIVMILIHINSSRNFSVGIFYRGRTISNYSVKELKIGMLLFTVSLVFTKFNA